MLAAMTYKADLIIADSPYNIGMAYDIYNDERNYREYFAWCKQWLARCSYALAKTGSMWVFCPDEWVSEFDIYCRKILDLHKQRHVIWAFTFGQCAKRSFSRSHCHLLWMTKHRKSYTFNAAAVGVLSQRYLVGDSRAAGQTKAPDDTWVLLKDALAPYMGPDKDTWLASRICGTFSERQAHVPNQLPLAIVERIVLACSNPGDRVVDPFAGTCSSAIPCAWHGRFWEGFDISAKSILAGNRRISEANDRLRVNPAIKVDKKGTARFEEW